LVTIRCKCKQNRCAYCDDHSYDDTYFVVSSDGAIGGVVVELWRLGWSAAHLLFG